MARYLTLTGRGARFNAEAPDLLDAAEAGAFREKRVSQGTPGRQVWVESLRENVTGS